MTDSPWILGALPERRTSEERAAFGVTRRRRLLASDQADRSGSACQALPGPRRVAPTIESPAQPPQIGSQTPSRIGGSERKQTFAARADSDATASAGDRALPDACPTGEPLAEGLWRDSRDAWRGHRRGRVERTSCLRGAQRPFRRPRCSWLPLPCACSLRTPDRTTTSRPVPRPSSRAGAGALPWPLLLWCALIAISVVLSPLSGLDMEHRTATACSARQPAGGSACLGSVPLGDRISVAGGGLAPRQAWTVCAGRLPRLPRPVAGCVPCSPRAWLRPASWAPFHITRQAHPSRVVAAQACPT